MKKILAVMFALALSFNTVYAKNYAKMQIKEMKHAQKYGTTKKVLQNQQIPLTPVVYTATNIKDPKIMKFGDYKIISDEEYNAKLKEDEKKYAEYEKRLGKSASKHYKTQADAIDFYNVYRVAEKLIRANNLDYINWRIEISKDSEDVNAFSTNTNYINITTALIDSFGDNEDAMAFVIGHEMGHALLGHQERRTKTWRTLQNQYELAKDGNAPAALVYTALKRKFIIDSKNMEYAADVEGVKLAMHAGFDLDNGTDIMAYFSTLPRQAEWKNDHPNPVKRMKNMQENARYFPKEWKDKGRANLYNSEPLPVRLSSDRKSMVISAPAEKLSANNYYSPETMQEVYARFGYMYYVNGEFQKSVEHFKELFKIDKTNAPAYLYASYACEYLYKNQGDKKYLKLAKDYAQKALSLDPSNKYMKEQVDAL